MKTKKLISTVFITSFLILMFNGLLDLAYGFKQQLIRIDSDKHLSKLLPENTDEEKYFHHIQDGLLINYQMLPLIGKMQMQGEYGIYSIGADGNRLYPEQPLAQSKAKKKILILGSSQSFGYLNDSANDLVAQLSKMLPGYHIDNFSVPGQKLRENLSLFKYLVSLGKKYDLVYVINGPMDAFAACFKAGASEPLPPAISFNIGITKLVNKLIKVVNQLSGTDSNTIATSVNMCSNKPFDTLVVDDAIGAVQQILDYGNNQEKIKTIVIIPPTPYTLSEKLNTKNLVHDQAFVSLKPVLGKLIGQFAKRTSTSPGVYDLTHSLDDFQSQSFIDIGGHLTPQGNKILAQAIEKLTESNVN